MNPSVIKSNVLQSSNFGNSNNRLSPVALKNDLNKSHPVKRKLLPVRDTSLDAPTGRKSSFGAQPPASVARRNARERNRVKQLNMGFSILRQHIPVLVGSQIVYGGSQTVDSDASSGSKKNKMSKVETLRNAVEYIRNLEKLLNGDLPSAGTEEMFIKQEADEFRSSTPVSHADDENVSPDLRSNSGSGNDLSSYYDSSSSVSPEACQPNPRFLFPFASSAPLDSKSAKDSATADCIKQELIRSLACYRDGQLPDEDVALPEIFSADDHPSMAHPMSENSLLESINNWWLPAM